MRGALVYHSKYGNNEKTARAIYEGIKETGHQLDLINTAKQKDLGEGYQFMVVGSPTRFGRMSGPVKRFIKRNLQDPGWKDRPYAAFGTCLQQAREKDESTSAKDIQEKLENIGLRPVVGPFEACVGGMKGPLDEGFEQKARDFGRKVGVKLSKESSP